jgi:hypothetical protein
MTDRKLKEIKDANKNGMGSSFNSDSNFDSESNSDDYESARNTGSDVSGETHTFEGSENSSETSYSDSDGDEGLEGFDNKIRVYDARFKIPARQTVGQLMTGKTKDPKI